MIIFNNSISKFYQCSIRGFCWGIIYVFYYVSAKKKETNEEAIKFLEMLKKICLQE